MSKSSHLFIFELQIDPYRDTLAASPTPTPTPSPSSQLGLPQKNYDMKLSYIHHLIPIVLSENKVKDNDTIRNKQSKILEEISMT